MKNDNVAAYSEIMTYLKESDIDVKSTVTSMNLSSNCKFIRLILNEI